ncbi:hypothetical protein [Methanobacterium formicicum]|jgi:hypothetical protein|uniref:hypothetical protein n=1 Tax=Methanobacterium formicicum TaxID=2162 RepID=UPI0024925F01|nr:hypothetical protein [Methanobacterium formicicum]
MERQNLILAAVVILVVVLAFVVAMSLYGNNSFQKGQMSFQYPNAWAQDHVIGNFSQNTIYSEVTLKYTTGVTGQDSSAFIIVSMQPKPQGLVNAPNATSLITNTSNSSAVNVGVSNLAAIQMGSYSQNTAQKTTIIEKNNYYYTLEYICSPLTLNQTEEAYKQILQTLKIV